MAHRTCCACRTLIKQAFLYNRPPERILNNATVHNHSVWSPRCCRPRWPRARICARGRSGGPGIRTGRGTDEAAIIGWYLLAAPSG